MRTSMGIRYPDVQKKLNCRREGCLHDSPSAPYMIQMQHTVRFTFTSKENSPTKIEAAVWRERVDVSRRCLLSSEKISNLASRSPDLSSRETCPPKGKGYRGETSTARSFQPATSILAKSARSVEMLNVEAGYILCIKNYS